jgi:meiotic recombination protein REC8
MLQDDPAFLPDTALPALDFDLSNLELEPSGNSQRSGQSMMSIRQRSGSITSSHAGSFLGLNLSSSSVNGVAGQYQLTLNDPFAESSAQKQFGAARHGIFDDEANLYQDDMIFEFDENGGIRDIPASERAARRAGSVHPQGRLESGSAASGRVRREHEEAIAGRALPILDGEGDFDMVQFPDDNTHILPDAEAFPIMTGGLGGNDKPMHVNSYDRVFSEEPSSESAGASQKRKKAKALKTLAADQTLELRNNDLIRWQREYLNQMIAENLVKSHRKELAEAKKNAFSFVYGSGINGVGNGVGSSKLESPLAMFSGEALFTRITGKPAPTSTSRVRKGSKRTLNADNDEHDSPKRARQSTPEGEIGRAAPQFEDDAGMMLVDDEIPSIEIGRDAPSALADYPSSAMMPWNISASLHSHQRGVSSSIKGRGMGLGSQLAGSATGRRLASASPLIGRGSNAAGMLEHFSMLEDDAPITYGRDDIDDGTDFARGGSQRAASQRSGAGGGISSSQAPGTQLNEFEIFGPSAAVDTQTAASSQWVREALDRESNNFLEYVKNTISEKLPDEFGDEFGDEEGEVFGRQRNGNGTSVSFEELFEPESNSAIVAAQAFYHVLSLATKRLVKIEQIFGEGEEEHEGPPVVPFGEIRVWVV